MSSDLSLIWLWPVWNRPVIFCFQGKDVFSSMSLTYSGDFREKGGSITLQYYVVGVVRLLPSSQLKII